MRTRSPMRSCGARARAKWRALPELLRPPRRRVCERRRRARARALAEDSSSRSRRRRWRWRWWESGSGIGRAPRRAASRARTGGWTCGWCRWSSCRARCSTSRAATCSIRACARTPCSSASRSTSMRCAPKAPPVYSTILLYYTYEYIRRYYGVTILRYGCRCSGRAGTPQLRGGHLRVSLGALPPAASA